MWTTCQRFERNKYNKALSTRIRIFLNPQLFLSGYGFSLHVSGESETF